MGVPELVGRAKAVHAVAGRPSMPCRFPVTMAWAGTHPRSRRRRRNDAARDSAASIRPSTSTNPGSTRNSAFKESTTQPSGKMPTNQKETTANTAKNGIRQPTTIQFWDDTWNDWFGLTGLYFTSTNVPGMGWLA